MQIEQWFPVPVGICNISKECLEEVQKACFEWLKNNPLDAHWSESVETSYHKSNSFISQIGLNSLENELLNLFCDYSKSLGLQTPSLRLDSWLNRFKPKSSEPAHAHYNAFLCGCLYLTEEADSGKFMIDDPINARCQWLENNYIGSNTLFTHRTVGYDPQEGKVLIFPPWMKHYVTQHNGLKDRISLAFNAIKC